MCMASLHHVDNDPLHFSISVWEMSADYRDVWQALLCGRRSLYRRPAGTMRLQAATPLPR